MYVLLHSKVEPRGATKPPIVQLPVFVLQKTAIQLETASPDTPRPTIVGARHWAHQAQRSYAEDFRFELVRFPTGSRSWKEYAQENSRG